MVVYMHLKFANLRNHLEFSTAMTAFKSRLKDFQSFKSLDSSLPS